MDGKNKIKLINKWQTSTEVLKIQLYYVNQMKHMKITNQHNSF
jgi:hypothetical protein